MKTRVTENEKKIALKVSKLLFICSTIIIIVTAISIYIFLNEIFTNILISVLGVLFGFLTSSLYFIISQYLSRKYEIEIYANKPPDEEIISAIKQMDSNYFRFGITLHEMHNGENNQKKYHDEIINNIKRERKQNGKLTLRFLLLKPYSKYIEAREDEQGEERDTLSDQVLKTIDELHNIYNSINTFNLNEKVTIKCHIYEAMPTISVFLIDERLFVGPYIPRERGYKSPWIEIPEDEMKAINKYKQAFISLWRESDNVDLSKKGVEQFKMRMEEERNKMRMEEERNKMSEFNLIPTHFSKI
ncbi:MAG: DUF5919 domain-containing protein [Bacilli bacterium]|nr:DUF5919 domain-containing protein [Bacilli bacterium]